MSLEQRDRERIRDRLKEERFDHEDVLSLQRNPRDLARAVPVLAGLITEIESPRVKIDLVRAIRKSIPPRSLVDQLQNLAPAIDRDYKPSADFARLSGRELFEELDRIGALSSGAESLGWALAEALVQTVDASVYDDIVQILRDKQFGKTRQMLPYALAKVSSRRDETIQLFVELIEDTGITSHILDAIGIMKATEALPIVEEYLESSVPLQKRTAKKTLKRLQAQLGKKASKSKARILPPRSPEELVNLAEASMNFDLEQVEPFLASISRLVGSLDAAERRYVVDRLLEMESDEEASFDFTVVHEGEAVPLHIEVFMDDVDAPDVAFITTPELAAAIDRLMEKAMQ